MMRLAFGALLGLLAAYPSLLSTLLTVAAAVAAVASQPVVLAVAAGFIAWPRITRRIRGWAR